MKFKLLATSLAALAATSAYAQSSVTLYGVADVGVEYLSQTAKDASVVRMTSGNMSGSRWGLRGVEDLGGGLKGVFALESGFSVDTGAGGTRLFDRQAYVGLQGGYGAVTLGRHQTPLYDFSVQYDPMALAPRYSMYSQDSGMASRADNSIKYTGTFGSLTASALYSFGYDGNGEVPGNYRQGKQYEIGLNYAAGPFAVGTVYQLKQPTADSKVQRATVAGTYAFGPAKAFVGYRWAHVTAEGDPGARANLYWTGLGYNVTPALNLTGAVYYQDNRRTSADPWQFVLSADYALSKRTDVYLNMAYMVNRKDSERGYVSAYSLGDPGVVPGQNQFGTVIGMRHKF